MSLPLLDHLRRVPGVIGSFACTPAGHPLVCDYPGASEAEVRRAASAALSLLGLGRDSIRDCSRLCCRFERANLEVLAFEHGFLCVVVDSDHDRALLSAAMRLVGRRFLEGKPRDRQVSG